MTVHNAQTGTVVHPTRDFPATVLRDFPAGTYDLAVIDPPWPYWGNPDKWGAAGKHYPLMTAEEIASIPIGSLLAPRGVVFVWCTCPMVALGVHTIEAWGLAVVGIPFIWEKTDRDGHPVGAQGVRPSITKPTAEFVLAGSRVKRGRPMAVADEGVPQIVRAPRGEHSAKPPAVMQRIERLFPSARRLELFARRHRPGWEAWGDELDSRTTVSIQPPPGQGSLLPP
jgi:N6-adenosine-specific RNA methylase IME4